MNIRMNKHREENWEKKQKNGIWQPDFWKTVWIPWVPKNVLQFLWLSKEEWGVLLMEKYKNN